MSTRQYSFPEILSSIDTVTKVFSKFRYWRGKLKLEFRMTSTVYHQGSLMFGWLPCVSTAISTPDLFTLSGCNAHILSATTKDNLSIELPYFNPMEWVDILGGKLTPDGRVATGWLSELNTLLTTSSAISASIPMNVYASFTEIEMMGFSSHSKDPGVIKELQNKNQNGINAKTVVSGVSQIVRALPVVGPIWGAIATILNTFSGDLAKPVNDRVATPMYIPASSDSALCHGVALADEVSMYSQALISQTRSLNGMCTSHMTLNELARKPMLHLQYKFDGTNTSFGLTTTPQYQNYSDQRNIDWLWAISYAFKYWKGSIKYLIHFVLPSFQSFRAQITLLDQLNITPDSTGDLMNKIIDVAGETWIEVSVPFLRSTIWTDPYLESQATAGSCPVLQITQLTPIVGSSLPSTPVCYINVFRAGGEDTAFRCLQNAGHAVPITMNNHCSLETKFKSTFDPIFPGAKQSIEKGYIAPEIAATVSDCLKRASATVFTSGGTIDNSAPFNFPAGTGNINYIHAGLEPYQYFSSMFMFWRGSRIVRNNQGTNLWGVLGSGVNAFTWGDGAAIYFPSGSAGLNYREAVCCDYRSMFPYVPVGQPGVPFDAHNFLVYSTGTSTLLPFQQPVVATNTWTAATTYTIAAGDDFMLLHPIPFFPTKFYPTVTLIDEEKTMKTTKPEKQRKSVNTSQKNIVKDNN